MFRLHMQGLSICVRSKKELTVLMMNSAARKTYAPFHLQTLFVPRKSLDLARTTMPALPTVMGRWRANTDAKAYVGFSLPGYVISIGTGNAPVRPSSEAQHLQHPISKSKPDFSDLHWVLNANRLLPNKKIKASAFKLGDDIMSIARIRGGRLEGGNPIDAQGAEWIWRMRKGYQQALTDTIDVVYDTATPTFTIRDSAGKLVGRIAFKDKSEAYLVNDARELDSIATENQAGRSQAGDTQMFLELFNLSPADRKAIRPVPVRNWRTKKIFSGPGCPILFSESAE